MSIAGVGLGLVGALRVQMPDGRRFSVGTGLSDAERKSPPPGDSLITDRYQELSEASVPRFPAHVGRRADVQDQAPAVRVGTHSGPASGRPKNLRLFVSQDKASQASSRAGRASASFRLSRSV
jgi:hypothetical protein